MRINHTQILENPAYKNLSVILGNHPKEYTVIDYLTIAAFYMHAIYSEQIVVAVADIEKYRVYIPGKRINHNLKAGDKLVKGSIMSDAINNKKRISKKIDENVFGFPYIGTAYPIYDQSGKVVAGLIICESNEGLANMTVAASDLNNVSERIIEMVEDLETSNGKLSGVGEKLSELSSDSLEKVAATDEILKSIGGIAKQSNILGINAAIEAARAGELGKGFGVVAKEIQKFSNQNVNSLKIIEETLKQICASSENVNDEVGHIREFVKKQAEVMSELSSVTQQLYSVSVLLKDLAEKMIERK
ncbi:methyl-accepting chemotaxis protein [Crassaminicella profunda]|uniref:methyl-accepting chemotaxis protein n=1 Tax=Crassaminicella profunda TaxID=1286698 RepID=UPI001CA655CA|nr:methyl-accepting chemotaxis protein [Crassaminicella profunda]QZY56284.1 hypothetical protein K7H06_04680 [Crassaminicella profunda]